MITKERLKVIKENTYAIRIKNNLDIETLHLYIDELTDEVKLLRSENEIAKCEINELKGKIK